MELVALGHQVARLKEQAVEIPLLTQSPQTAVVAVEVMAIKLVLPEVLGVEEQVITVKLAALVTPHQQHQVKEMLVEHLPPEQLEISPLDGEACTITKFTP